MNYIIQHSKEYLKYAIYKYVSMLLLMPFLSISMIAQSETGYEIQMFRPAVTGQKFHFTLEADSKRTQQVFRRQAPNAPEETIRSIHMSGVLEVLAVSSFGDMTEAKYEITAFSASDANTNVDGLNEGDILLVRLEGDSTRYYRNNRAVSEELSELLGYVIKLRTPEMPRDLDYFVIDGAQHPGAQWPIDTLLAAKSLSQNEIRVDPGNVSGESRFVEILDYEGESCYRIVGNVRVSSLEIKMPRFSKLENANIHVDFEGIYPVNLQLPVLDSKSTLTLTAKAGGTGLLRSIRMELQETREVRRILKPLDAGPVSRNDNEEATTQSAVENKAEDELDEDEWQVISVE